MAQALPSSPTHPPSRVVNFPTRRPPRWRWVVPGALLLVAAAIGVLYMTGQLTAVPQRLLGQTTATTYQTTPVARGTIAETITATGPVAAALTLPVNFQSAGTLAEVKVTVGQPVKKGDVLARIDTTNLQAALDQAKASLTQAEASYAKARSGASPEERAAAQVALENAQRAADDAARSAAASQASAQKDVETAQASIATAATSVATARDNLAAAQAQMEAKLASDRLAIQNAEQAVASAEAVIATLPAIQKEQLDAAKTSLWATQIGRDQSCGRAVGCEVANAQVAAAETNVHTVEAQQLQAARQSEQTLQQARNAVETARAAMASDEVSLAASVKAAENAVKAAQAGVNTAQANASKAQTSAAASAQSAQGSANSALNQVKSAEASLAQTAAGPLKTDVDIAAAQVANARVTVQLAQNALDAALLKAPIDGTVAAVTAAVGQQVGTNGAASTTSSTATTATSGFITLMTLQDLTVTAQVNEADVGKVTIGDPVSFTTSAFPGKVFGGQVTQIQPTGTTTSNVVSFAVTSSIKPLEGVALYPGMTATVTITTDEHKDVLTVPNSALSFAQTAARSTTTTGATTAGAQTAAAARPTGAGGQGAGAASAAAAGQGTSRSVMLLQDGQATPTRVTTGMTDGTNTEVVSGLQESQPVIVSQSGGTTATTAATGTTAATRTGAPATNPLTGGGPGFVAKP